MIKKGEETGKMLIICSNPSFSRDFSEDFFKDPKKILKEYNIRTDSAAFLRRVLDGAFFISGHLWGSF